MVRPSELAVARRAALSKLAASRQGARPSQLTAVLVGLDPDNDSRVIVSFDGSEVSVLSGPHKLVPGSLVAVEVDSANAPVRVAGPVTVRPVGLAEDADPPEPVTPMPALAPRELTEVEAQAIADSAAGLADAQDRLADAENLLDALDAADGPEGVAAALTDYLSVPLDQITVVDNRGADGQVVANLYDAIIVDGLLTAEKVITEELLADGAVTARTLNVVPAEGSGGVEILPPGLRIIPEDVEAGTSVSLRVDEPSVLQFARDGVATFSVTPEGELTAQSVAANESLEYRGVELEDRLTEPTRGVLRRTRLTSSLLSDGAWCLLSEIKFLPVPGRAYSATIQYAAQSSTLDDIGGQVAAQFAGDGMTFRQSWSIPRWNVNPARPVAGTVTFDFNADEPILDADGMATLKVFGRSVVPGRQVRFYGYGTSSIDGTTGCGVTLRDDGLAAPVDLQAGNEPPLIGSGGTTPPPSGGGSSKSRRSTPVYSNAFRTFPVSGVRHVRADKSVVQGYTSGVHSTGHWYFPSVTGTLSGASDMSGSLTITNEHTYHANGMTIGLWAHNYASPTSSFGTASKIGDYHVGRAKAITISLPAGVLDGLKAGTIRGFGLSHGTSTSREFYGYFSKSATLRLNYTK